MDKSGKICKCLYWNACREWMMHRSLHWVINRKSPYRRTVTTKEPETQIEIARKRYRFKTEIILAVENTGNHSIILREIESRGTTHILPENFINNSMTEFWKFKNNRMKKIKIIMIINFVHPIILYFVNVQKKKKFNKL